MFNTLRHQAARLRAFFRSSELDQEFAQELNAHIEMLTDEYRRRGMSATEAARAARVRTGAPVALAIQHRETRGLPLLDGLIQDLRFACRLLLKDRWFSAAAIAALALGIGANATGFTIINGVFLRGLPVAEADRLLVLSWQNRSSRRSPVSYPELQDWRAATTSFANLAAYTEPQLNLSDDRSLPERVNGARVTANLFGLLRTPPLLGRDFSIDDERPGAEPVAIISAGLWQSRYFNDPAVLGTPLRVNGETTTIIGVMPSVMRFPQNTAVWLPLVPNAAQMARDARTLRVFGRLSDDADRDGAQAEFRAIAQRLITDYPDETKDVTAVRVETFTERFIGGAARPMFMTVMGAVTFVLLIACANVANMLLARSAHRAREVALRTAIGATRWRVIRQLLLESLVLSVIGAALGLVLALWGVRLFDLAMANAGMPYWVVFEFDAMVFGYVAAICVITATMFGLAPALHVSKANANTLLQEGGRSHSGSRRTRWFSSAMVVSQLALATILLSAAGILIRSFMTLYATDLGLPADRLLAMPMQLPDSKYVSIESRLAFFDDLENRVATVAGVEAVAVTTGVPPDDGGERLIQIAGGDVDAPPVFVGTVTVTPRFFEVLGVNLTRGRSFSERDGAAGLEAAIVNDQFAARFFPGEDPIGKRIRFTQRGLPAGSNTDRWRTVIGVVPLIKQASSLDGYVNSVVYLPYREAAPTSASLLVRTSLPAASMIDAVRRLVQRIDRDQPVLNIDTVAARMAATRWWQRTWGAVFGVLATIALTLSAIGLYAITAYSVTQRTQEIGVRMALGAQRRQLLWMILRTGVTRLLVGLAIGLAGTAVVAPIAARGMIDTAPGHVATFVAIVLILSLVSIVACVLPVRRATRIDPVTALRID